MAVASCTLVLCGRAGAVGRESAEPGLGRLGHGGHRQAEQEADSRHSDQPEHADGGRRTHAGFQIVAQESKKRSYGCFLGGRVELSTVLWCMQQHICYLFYVSINRFIFQMDKHVTTWLPQDKLE